MTWHVVINGDNNSLLPPAACLHFLSDLLKKQDSIILGWLGTAVSFAFCGNGNVQDIVAPFAIHRKLS